MLTHSREAWDEAKFNALEERYSQTPPSGPTSQEMLIHQILFPL